MCCFFLKQKTAYEMRISDWSSDVCSSDLFYGLGIPIGTLFGLAIGGFATDLWGWRFAFMLVGAPGILMAMALPFLLRDERRRPAAAPPAPGADLTVVGALREVFGTSPFHIRSTSCRDQVCQYVSTLLGAIS